MLYVHPAPKIVEFHTKTRDEVERVTRDFWAVRDDPVFFSQLYQRGKLAQRLKESMDQGKSEYPFDGETLRFRHGISPASFNVRNIRYK